jgi:Spy/CpxP family protein refolding chaperone
MVVSGALAVGLGLLSLQGYAWARYHGHGGGSGVMAAMRVVRPTLSQAQKEQIKSLFQTKRAALKADHQSVREARQNLAQAILSKGDVKGAIGRLQLSQGRLLQDRTDLAQQIVAVLTPEQLNQAKNFLTQWQSLRQQQHQQREALFHQFMQSKGGSND